MFVGSGEITDLVAFVLESSVRESEMVLVPLAFLVEIEERFLSVQADAFARTRTRRKGVGLAPLEMTVLLWAN